MSVRHEACVIVECDTPKCDSGYDEGTPHFDSEEQAFKHLLGDDGWGWSRLPDGRLLCASCSQRAECEATGHKWSEWRPRMRWDADGRRSVPEPGSPTEWRSCNHCGGAFEERITGTDVVL